MKTATPKIWNGPGPTWHETLLTIDDLRKSEYAKKREIKKLEQKIAKLEKRAKQRNDEIAQMRKYIKMMEQANERMQAIAFPESSEVRGAYSITATEVVNPLPKCRGEY